LAGMRNALVHKEYEGKTVVCLVSFVFREFLPKKVWIDQDR